MNKSYSEPSTAIKIKFFEQGIGTLLKNKYNVPGPVLDWLVDESWGLWCLNTTEQEFNRIKIIENICTDLIQKYPSEGKIILAKMLSEIPDSEIRAQTSRDQKVEEGGKESLSRILLSRYTAIFENEYRIWITPVFAAAILLFKANNSLKNYEDAVFVSGSKKFYIIKSIKDKISYGYLNEFNTGFEIELRNSGTGHESFEVLNDGAIQLRPTNPETGEIKKGGNIIITQKDIKDKIKLCEKTLLILKIGFTIFLANNIKIAAELQTLSPKPLKIKSIRDNLESQCEKDWFILNSFEYLDDIGQFKVEINYTPKIYGYGGKIFFGTTEAYDLVNKEVEIKYKTYLLKCVYQITQMAQASSLIFNNLSIQINNDKKESEMLLNFDQSELIKFLKNPKILPRPISGEYNNSTYKVIHQLRVPYGEHGLWKDFVDAL